MEKLDWSVLAAGAAAIVLVLGGCSPVATALTAAPEAARLAGGGPYVINGQPIEGLVISATGTASADPEVAQISFGVALQGPNADALVTEGATKMDAAIVAAEAFGIAADETRTLNYSLRVETSHDPATGRPTDEIIYHLSHQVRVTTDNTKDVGGLLAALVDAGANVISGVTFTVKDQDGLVDSARAAALAEAADRAEQTAAQLGVSLGRPVLVTQSGGDSPVAAEYSVGRGGAAMEAAAPRVDAGSFSVSVSVQVVYEIR